MSEKRFQLVHRRPRRWFHWLNFFFLFGMVYSGLMIYWTNDVYELRLGETTLFHFFPNAFFELFDLEYRLAEGMGIHFLFFWLFLLNGLAYVVYLGVSGGWRELAPRKQDFPDAVKVTLHDLHLRKALPLQGKYNAAQKIAYTVVVLMGAGSLITGFAIYKPTQLGWLTGLLGGYEMARQEHFWLTMLFVAFLGVHLLQVARAGWDNFRGMVVGYSLRKPIEDASRARRDE